MNQRLDGRKADMSLAIVSMLHGAHERRVLGSRDDVIMSCVTAAISFSINTGGRDGEAASIDKVQAILDDLKASYSKAVEEGYCRGSTTGGYARGR